MSTLASSPAHLARPAQPDLTSLGQEGRQAVERVSHVYRNFLAELGTIARGLSRPLVKTDEDCEGADFAFVLEVKQGDYERVVHETSVLEARYHEQFGVNFVVIPEVM